jgi:hypothetical protein
VRRRHLLVGSALVALREIFPARAQSCFVNECVPGPNKDLKHCNFQGAGNGGGWDFSGSDLTGANFLEADLRYADFSYANLEGACFLGADLRGAVFTSSEGIPASMCWARITEAHVGECLGTSRCCPAAEYDAWVRGQ